MDERKKRTTSLFLTYLLPTSCCRGWWVAGQQTHGTPPATQLTPPLPLWLFFFLWPLRRLWTLTKNKEKTVTSKIFQENFKWKAKCKKEVPFISSDIFFFVSLVFSWTPPRRLTIPQGLAGTRRFPPTFQTISVIIIFFPSVSAEFRFANFMQRITTLALSLSCGGRVICFFWIFSFPPRMLCET